MKTKVLIVAALAAFSVTTASAAVGDSYAESVKTLQAAKAKEVRRLDLAPEAENPEHGKFVALSHAAFANDAKSAYLLEQFEDKTADGSKIQTPRGRILSYQGVAGILQESSYIDNTIHTESYTLIKGNWSEFPGLLDALLKRNTPEKTAWAQQHSMPEARAEDRSWEATGGDRATIAHAYIRNEGRTLYISNNKLFNELSQKIDAEKRKLTAEYQAKAAQLIR